MVEEKIATLVCTDCGRTQDSASLLSEGVIKGFEGNIKEGSPLPVGAQCQKCGSPNVKLTWTTRRQKEAFRRLSSQTARRYWEKGGWSSFELEIKEVLDGFGLKEQVDYFHNFKLHTPTQKGFYSLDFIFPALRLVIEANGFVWHSLGNSEKKDAVRTGWLARLGFRVEVLPGEEYNDHEKLRKKITELLAMHSQGV